MANPATFEIAPNLAEESLMNEVGEWTKHIFALKDTGNKAQLIAHTFLFY